MRRSVREHETSRLPKRKQARGIVLKLQFFAQGSKNVFPFLTTPMGLSSPKPTKVMETDK